MTEPTKNRLVSRDPTAEESTLIHHNRKKLTKLNGDLSISNNLTKSGKAVLVMVRPGWDNQAIYCPLLVDPASIDDLKEVFKDVKQT